ncbi:MAG TPA: MlaD family protein [Gammaproteobacteria bacterium]|nr:MlaD family protein [Gammaproteobacteria bacterium]
MSEVNRRPAVHYVHRLSYTAQERLVGVFVLTALALLLVLIVLSREAATLFQEKFTVYALMRNAQGISTDTKVRVSGIEVGEVASLDIAPDNRVRVEMEIFERFHELVRADSRAMLSKLSLFGNPAIEITTGSPDRPVLADGSEIQVDEAMSVDQILAEVMPALRNAQQTLERINAITQKLDPEDVAMTLGGVAQTSVNLEKITAQLAAGRGALGQLMFDPGAERDFSEALGALARTLGETEARMREIAPVLADARTASRELPALLAESRRLVVQLNTTIATVNYELQSLPDMVVKTRQLMDQVDRTLTAIQNTWPISATMAKPDDETLLEPRPATD